MPGLDDLRAPAPVVCGVDREAQAGAVAGVAAELAARLGTRLILVHGADLPPLHAQVRQLPMGVEHEASRHRREIEAWLHGLAEQAGAADADVRAEFGPAADWIVATADAERAALVVVGSRPREGWRALPLGGVATAVTQQAPCPVVVVPHAAARGGWPRSAGGQVVCGVAGPEDAPAAALAAALADVLGTALTLVHVRPSRAGAADGPIADPGVREGPPGDRAALRMLRDVAARIGEPAGGPHARRTLRLRLRRGDPARQLAAVESAALLVVGSRGHGPIRAGLLGSTSRRLAANATAVPVAIRPPGARVWPVAARRPPAVAAALSRPPHAGTRSPGSGPRG